MHTAVQVYVTMLVSDFRICSNITTRITYKVEGGGEAGGCIPRSDIRDYVGIGF